MKRFVSVLWIFAILLTLAGCSSSTVSKLDELSSLSTKQEVTVSMTTGEQNALSAAASYLSFMTFSRDGLVSQLEYEGYSTAEAAFAADHCGADWNEQAAKAAENYLSMTAFSYEGLVEQLEFEGYTAEQAAYGADCAYRSVDDSSAVEAFPSIEISDIPGSGDAAADSTLPSDSSVSMGEKNALRTAENYLSMMAFSYTGLIEQLEFEGYSAEEAAYAADHCGANWNEQAAKAAKSYLSMMAFSYEGLVEQLEFEGYTPEQATYGADYAYQTTDGSSSAVSSSSAGESNALKAAKSYLSMMAFSYAGLVEQLEFEGYSADEAAYAADHCGADWNEQAAKAAESYLSTMAFSRSSLIEQLEFDGFTYEQAVYGVQQNGY